MTDPHESAPRPDPTSAPAPPSEWARPAADPTAPAWSPHSSGPQGEEGAHSSGPHGEGGPHSPDPHGQRGTHSPGPQGEGAHSSPHPQGQWGAQGADPQGQWGAHSSSQGQWGNSSGQQGQWGAHGVDPQGQWGAHSADPQAGWVPGAVPPPAQDPYAAAAAAGALPHGQAAGQLFTGYDQGQAGAYPGQAHPGKADPYQYGPAYGQPQPGVNYGYGYGYAPPVRTNGLATASMITSICALTLAFCFSFTGIVGLVGAILGHVARRQIRERGENGSGMALAGIIVGWIGVALAVAMVAMWAFVSSGAFSGESYLG